MDEAPPVDISKTSFFKPLGYQANNCGYCKRKNSSPSYYVTSSRVRPDHYQELMDRGWRRSGQIYYKPDLPRSCCPHYTIRLLAEDFKPRQDQRKAVNRWNTFVLGQEYMRQAARLCPQTREEKKRRKTVFDLTTEVHRSEYSNIKRPVDPKTKKAIEPAHRFEITIESDSFSDRKWMLFQEYQAAVHKEAKTKNTKKTFERFLCSGLRRSEVKEDGRTKRLGSYHMCYRLDGNLIAIGVLDLLPHAVSSVYLLYDPKYEEYEFGKLSALREIALALEEDYRYYYMGYYIHTCVKMRYKNNFRPQQILDPENLEYYPLDTEVLRQLDTHRYYSKSAAADRSNIDTAASNAPTSTLEAPTDTKSQPQPAASAAADSDSDDPEIPDVSLFNLNIPGVLTKDQVLSNFDLNNWRIMIDGQTIELGDIRNFDQQSITDSQSLKGIAGELVAALGTNVAKDSVMMLF